MKHNLKFGEFWRHHEHSAEFSTHLFLCPRPYYYPPVAKATKEVATLGSWAALRLAPTYS